MFLLGTLVNALGIFLGSLVGIVIPHISDKIKTTITQGLALTIILIGLSMALSDHASNDVLVIILSMVIGGVIGEWIDIEAGLNRLGVKMQSAAKNFSEGPIAEAFVASSLLFCVGSMAIIGAIQSGAEGSNKILYAKTLLDTFTSVVFASTLGVGVSLSAIPVLLYEGAISTVAYFLGASFISPEVMVCMTATGGLLIVGIGINILELKRIAVGNLLPSMFIAGIIRWAYPLLFHFFTFF